MSTTSAAETEIRNQADQPSRITSILRWGLNPEQSASRPLWIGLAISLALLLSIFWPTLRHFVYTWSTDENYGHGFLVPLISIYFANEASKRGPLASRGGLIIGVALLVTAVLGRISTILVPIGIVGDIAFLFALGGLLGLFAGREALRRYSFPLIFLIFMVPLPIALYTAIASPLQKIVSQVSSGLLNAIGVPVLCHGNIMTLPGGVQMFVAEACSGMRQLTGFLALTTAVAYLGRRSIGYRIAIILSAIPIAMAANVIRVMTTGLIMYHVDPKFALGAYHTAEGLIMMFLGLALLASVCKFLSWVIPPREGEEAPSAKAVAPRAARTSSEARVRAAVGCGLLAMGWVAQGATERIAEVERLPLSRPLATLPYELGGWRGVDVPIDPRVESESQATEYLNRAYEHPARPGSRLTLWINYSEHGLNMRHSPEVCLPSGGWEKIESQTRVQSIETSSGPMLLTRLVYRQGELVQSIGFWYYIFGETWLERSVRKLPITSRSSHGRTTRGSGLTVEIFCPGETDPDGSALQEFAKVLLAELEPLLPADRESYHIP